MANWLFAQTIHVVGQKFIFLGVGRYPGVVLKFRFRENRLKGLRDLEDRKSPFPITLAGRLYNSWIQAVITIVNGKNRT